MTEPDEPPRAPRPATEAGDHTPNDTRDDTATDTSDDTSDDTAERPSDAAVTLANVLHSLRTAEIAIGERIAREDYTAAGQLAAIARQYAVTALDAALTSTTLPPSSRTPVSVDDIRHAERRLDIAPGTFTSFFDVNFEHDDRARRKALQELLVEVRDDLARAPVVKAPHEPPSWLPAVIRIASAVLVGTAVGAPLAALAVGEPVVVEVVKAGIAVTACAVAAEVTNQALAAWLQRPEPPARPDTVPWSPLDELTRDLPEPLIPLEKDLDPVKPPELDPPEEPAKPPELDPPEEPAKPPELDPPEEPAKPPELDPPEEPAKPPELDPPEEPARPPELDPWDLDL